MNVLKSHSTVRFPSFDGYEIKGEWSLPHTAARAVAVILQGSGNVAADGDVSSPFVGFGYKKAPAKLSEQLAAALGEASVASLRFTKRGYETDPALAVAQSIETLTRDGAAALAEAKRKVPGVPVLLVGFSEGALIACRLAADDSTNSGLGGLFLFGLPSDGVDTLLNYQFVEWPSELLRTTLDKDRDGVLSASELAAFGNEEPLPLFGTPWSSIDMSRKGSLSIEADVVPAYQSHFRQLQPVLNTPAFRAWYESMRSLPAFVEIASRIHTPTFLYHGAADAQVPSAIVRQALKWFPRGVIQELRVFDGLGHCFSPMEGAIGQIKTSGPIDRDVLGVFGQDLQRSDSLGKLTP